MSIKKDYDLVVLGSGVAGSTLAMVLGAMGYSVLVVEKRSHPRFVIGEATLPTITLIFRDLAEKYNCKPLLEVMNFMDLKKHKLTAYPKNHFWFGFNEEGKSISKEKELLLETLLMPIGPDMHYLREDLDHFLVKRLSDYENIDYSDHTEIVNYDNSGAANSIELVKNGETFTLTSKYVVDCSGHGSFLGHKFNLRNSEPSFSTNTRSIFGHFKGIKNLDDVLGYKNNAFRFKREAGTMHNMFPGGWAWSIPFDNEVTSIGFLLDRDKYPLDDSISPEEEIQQLIAKFPSMEATFKDIQAITPIVRTDRIQFDSKSIVGDKFILTPHAAGFIDPLYSSGLLLTGVFIDRFARVFKEAEAANDFSPERFKEMEQSFFAESKHVDNIISSSFSATYQGFELFKQVWRSWVYGSFFSYATKFIYPEIRMQGAIYGVGIEDFRVDCEKMKSIVFDSSIPYDSKVQQISAMMDRWQSFVSSSIRITGAQFSDYSDSTSVATDLRDPGVLFKLLKYFPEKDTSVLSERSRYFKEEFANFFNRYDHDPQFKDAVRYVMNKSSDSFDYDSFLNTLREKKAAS